MKTVWLRVVRTIITIGFNGRNLVYQPGDWIYLPQELADEVVKDGSCEPMFPRKVAA